MGYLSAVIQTYLMLIVLTQCTYQLHHYLPHCPLPPRRHFHDADSNAKTEKFVFPFSVFICFFSVFIFI